MGSAEADALVLRLAAGPSGSRENGGDCAFPVCDCDDE
jgi:hypothetical protein